MTTVVAEVYDALREAGASEEKARKAAETIADYDNEFSEIKTELKVHRWILGSLERSAVTGAKGRAG